MELPDGSHLSIADLPPANTGRWVASRKAIVIKAVSSGLITKADACARWHISLEEFEGWCRAVAGYGESGLKTTALPNRTKCSTLKKYSSQ